MTHQSTTKGVMDIVHRAVQGVELCTSLATFLKFPLKTTEDVVESKAALARRAHAAAHTAHADEPLGLHRGATLANSWPLAVEVERVTRTSSRGHVLMVI